MGKWSKEWLKDIDEEKITIYPLQLANCDRMEKNKAVYIFDEVGSGKTISAGLMALHYLHKEPRAKVLVITTSQLADKGEEPGPFKQIWLDKLPFQKWMEERITVINHDYRNIRKVNRRPPVIEWSSHYYPLDKNNWGLVIIDEAHVFLNTETEKYRELVGDGSKYGKITAQKIVFLTATPIRQDWKNLYIYAEIAVRIIHSANNHSKSYNCFDDPTCVRVRAPKAKSTPLSPEELICSVFDPDLPFTRYFKDTVRALNPFPRGLRAAARELNSPPNGLMAADRPYPRRRLAETWECDRETRQETVLKKIDELYEKNPAKNRFVIFVRWVRKNRIDPGCSAEELEAYFIAHGYAKWEEASGKKSVEVVTGANHKLLSSYRDPAPDSLPTVLIVNCQIGEQGVNLPGYNHIINYHIPASPASLEQRFGRIDRLDSTSEELYTFFPLLKSQYDSSTINFYIAVSAYLRHQLLVLPARNSMLTEDILSVYEEYSRNMREQADTINAIRKRWESARQGKTDPWANILNYLDGMDSGTAGVDLDEDEAVIAEFILGMEDKIGEEEKNDAGMSQSDRIKRLRKRCEDRLKEMLAAAVPHEHVKAMKESIPRGDEFGNLIFYYADQYGSELPRERILKNLKTISPAGEEGCAGMIQESSEYRDYVENLLSLMRQLMEEEKE